MPKRQRTRIIAEMRARGMVTRTTLALLWGTTESAVTSMVARRRLTGGVFNNVIRTWFFPSETKKPARLQSGRKKRASRAMVPARDKAVMPGEEQIPLEVEWALWPAPEGGRRCLGWIGGMV